MGYREEHDALMAKIAMCDATIASNQQEYDRAKELRMLRARHDAFAAWFDATVERLDAEARAKDVGLTALGHQVDENTPGFDD